MEMQRSLQEIMERLLAEQQRIKDGQKEILVMLGGSTNCPTEMTSYPGEMHATRMVDLQAVVAAVDRQEFREKEINAKTIGSSEDRSGYRRLVVRLRREAKKRIQDSVGFRQKSSAARKRVMLRAVPAACKGNMRKSPGKNNVARGGSKGKMLGKRQRNNCDCENGRLDCGFKDQLCLRMRRTSRSNYRTPM
jgi:hypothetical protein